MFGIATKQGGISQAFPDVCKTPTPGGPVPIPYPNIAQLNQSSGVTTKVKVLNKPAVTMKSKVPISAGDEAGSAGGVVSSKIKGEAVPKKGSVKVKFEGSPVIYHTCPFTHNCAGANSNTVGTHCVPSQTTVTVTG